MVVSIKAVTPSWKVIRSKLFYFSHNFVVGRK